MKFIEQLKKAKKKPSVRLLQKLRLIKEGVFPYRNGQHIWGWGLWEQLQGGEAPSCSNSESVRLKTHRLFWREMVEGFSARKTLEETYA